MIKKTYTYDVSIPYYHHFLIQSERQLTREQVLDKAHAKDGSISGYDDSKAEITGILKKDFSHADEQIADLQDEIRKLYAQIEQNIDQIGRLYQGRCIEDEAPIPYYVDRQGMLHSPEAFRSNVREYVKDIMEDMGKNKEVIRSALQFHFLENGLPEKEGVE